MARPPTYQTNEEKPVTVSLRVPRELYAQAKTYAGQRRMSLTELLLDGLRLRLETPADPRDILVAQENTVMQEWEAMVDARIEVVLARERGTLTPEAVSAAAALTELAAVLDDAEDTPTPTLLHDENITVIQEPLEAPTEDIQAARAYVERYHRTTGDQEDGTPPAPAAARPRRGIPKLTPRQVKEMRAKRAKGAKIKALMTEYGLSKATVFRYLQ